MGSPSIQTQFAPSVTVQVEYRCGKEVKTTNRFERRGMVVTFRTRQGEVLEFPSKGKTIGEYSRWIEARLNNESNQKNKVLKIREIVD